jgi:hypothetical protein
VTDPDHVVQSAQQFRIVEQQTVCVDEFVDLERQCAMQTTAQFAQFLPRQVERVMQVFQLAFDLVLSQRPGVHDVTTGLHQSRAP